MADTVTSSKTLNIGLEYIDNEGDKKTATVKVPNQKDDLSENQIKNVFNNSVLIYGYNDDDEPQVFNSDNVLTASTVNETIRNVDIGWDD